MKKQYEKPQIIFDSFELSQSIAAGCAYVSNHAWEQCVIDTLIDDPEARFLFIKGVISGCTTSPAEGIGDRICYDTPNPSNNVFSS